MAPLPVVDNGWQIVVHGTAPSSQTWENVFGFDAGEAELTQEVTDAVASFISGAYGQLAGWSNAYQVNSITLTDLREVDGPQFESTNDLPVAGIDEANPLPLQTAALISWSTARRGRSFRGRTYLPGFTETFSDGAHITGDSYDSLSDFADFMLAAFSGLAVISRYSGVDVNGDPIPRDPGIVTDITGYTTHSLWKTQRRRAPRG